LKDPAVSHAKTRQRDFTAAVAGLLLTKHAAAAAAGDSFRVLQVQQA
jgi:hypothetical protein